MSGARATLPVAAEPEYVLARILPSTMKLSFATYSRVLRNVSYPYYTVRRDSSRPCVPYKQKLPSDIVHFIPNNPVQG